MCGLISDVTRTVCVVCLVPSCNGSRNQNIDPVCQQHVCYRWLYSFNSSDHSRNRRFRLNCEVNVAHGRTNLRSYDPTWLPACECHQQRHHNEQYLILNHGQCDSNHETRLAARSHRSIMAIVSDTYLDCNTAGLDGYCSAFSVGDVAGEGAIAHRDGYRIRLLGHTDRPPSLEFLRTYFHGAATLWGTSSER